MIGAFTDRYVSTRDSSAAPSSVLRDEIERDTTVRSDNRCGLAPFGAPYLQLRFQMQYNGFRGGCQKATSSHDLAVPLLPIADPASGQP